VHEDVHERSRVSGQILRKFGVATPRGVPCFSVAEADAAARELGGKVWVVKAQIHAGGRGKGGGVKVAKSLEEVHPVRRADPRHDAGDPPDRAAGAPGAPLLVEEGADIARSCTSAWSSTARRSA
jgi:succinyl-CoA synthetase beta subunit